MDIVRREPSGQDVELAILFCGVCHSDLHTVRSEWSGTKYPCVPGHEIVGRVTRVGANVRAFAPGQMAAVGVMVGSCGTCASCRERREQLCDKDPTFTYNSPDPHGTAPFTYGGYSSRIVVDEAFCFRLPDRLDPAAAAPLLCAGITLYSPLKHWGAGPGRTVGIVGLGGLGHMGVKFAHHLGAHTVLFTTSPAKAADGKRLGADEVVLSRDTAAMAARSMSLDLVVSTVSAPHNLDAYIDLLKQDGTLVLVGLPPERHPSPDVGKLILKRRRLAGSIIGSTTETQEMLDFCAERGIASDVEIIRIQDIERAYDRMIKGNVRYRFVIDMASL
jgi:alcohol dehydrogenase (NADP+)